MALQGIVAPCRFHIPPSDLIVLEAARSDQHGYRDSLLLLQGLFGFSHAVTCCSRARMEFTFQLAITMLIASLHNRCTGDHRELEQESLRPFRHLAEIVDRVAEDFSHYIEAQASMLGLPEHMETLACYLRLSRAAFT